MIGQNGRRYSKQNSTVKSPWGVPKGMAMMGALVTWLMVCPSPMITEGVAP